MGEKAKTKIRKVSASDAIPTVVWGGRKGRHPFPSPYFPFFPNAEPGLRLSNDVIQLTLTLKVTNRTGCRNVSYCQQHPSYSGLRSPTSRRSCSSYLGRYDYCVQTFHRSMKQAVNISCLLKTLLYMLLSASSVIFFFDSSECPLSLGMPEQLYLNCLCNSLATVHQESPTKYTPV